MAARKNGWERVECKDCGEEFEPSKWESRHLCRLCYIQRVRWSQVPRSTPLRPCWDDIAEAASREAGLDELEGKPAEEASA